jgi:hypothetical protein
MNSMTKPFDPQAVARLLLSHLADAVGDVASSMLEFPDMADKWEGKIKKAKKSGVQDLRGWLADEIYNDAESIEDLIGDKLHDECRGDKDKQRAVLDSLETGAHKGMKAACKSLRSNLG